MNFHHILLRSALILAGILTTAHAALADQASDLLAKHKAFVGWQFGDGTFSTLRLRETLRDSQQAIVRTTQIVRAGVAYRSTSKEQKTGDVTDAGFTGRVLWATNRNGFTRQVVGDTEKADIAFDILFNEGTTALLGVSEPSQVVDGQTYQVVRVKADASAAIDLYIDPQTGSYKRAVIDPGGEYEETLDILAYGDFMPGKKMITRWKYDNSQYIHERSDFQVNGSVTDDQLHPPKQSAIWTFANNKPFPIKVTDDRIYVDATVNGARGHFILDTGASSGILLTPDFVTRARVKHVENSEAYGLAGSTRTTIDKVDKVEIGGNTLSNVIVTSLSSNFEERERPDGLIGFDLFAAAIVTLDLDKQEMTIADPATSVVDKNAGISAVVDLSNQIPTIPAKLNGSIDVNAMLDSGNPLEVLFGPALINKYRLTMLVDQSVVGWLQSHPVMSGIGAGSEIEQCGKLQTISFGPIVYQQPPACESYSVGDFGERRVLVGFDFIKNFNYVFDYPESTLVLIPRKP